MSIILSTLNKIIKNLKDINFAVAILSITDTIWLFKPNKLKSQTIQENNNGFSNQH